MLEWFLVGQAVGPVAEKGISQSTGESFDETKDTYNLATGMVSGEPLSPLRDVMMKGIFALLRIAATRMEVLPLPPVRRIAIVGAWSTAEFGADVK